MAQPILHTERLRLEPLGDEHLECEIALDSDPEVMRYINGRAGSRAEVERAHSRRLRVGRDAPGFGFWAGFADDVFVGWWILQPPNGPDQPRFLLEANLGYRVRRDRWRRGYAREGARELIRYGFQVLKLKRIFAQTMAVNLASRATMTSAGLSFKRAFVSGASPNYTIAGTEQGEVEYDITRSRWRRERALFVSQSVNAGR